MRETKILFFFCKETNAQDQDQDDFVYGFMVSINIDFVLYMLVGHHAFIINSYPHPSTVYPAVKRPSPE